MMFSKVIPRVQIIALLRSEFQTVIRMLIPHHFSGTQSFQWNTCSSFNSNLGGLFRGLLWEEVGG